MDIRQFSIDGQIYAVSAGTVSHTTGTAYTYAISVYSPANSGKSLYIYDLDMEDNTGVLSVVIYQNLNAADPAYANVMTPANLGGIVQPSVMSVTNSGLLATFTPPGTAIMTDLTGSKQMNPLLFLGTGLHLPPSTQGNGYIIAVNITAAVGTGAFNGNLKYAEY